MRRALSSSDGIQLVQAERDVQARLEQVGVDAAVDFRSMAVVANVFRVATAAKHHLERTVLAREGLSFSAFTVLWVLWVWGEMEAQHLAVEADVAKGTLTGVVTTLERRGLVTRRRHGSDGRRVLVGCTPAGEALMAELFARFNEGEQRIVAGLGAERSDELADLLRSVLRSMEEVDA